METLLAEPLYLAQEGRVEQDASAEVIFLFGLGFFVIGIASFLIYTRTRIGSRLDNAERAWMRRLGAPNWAIATRTPAALLILCVVAGLALTFAALFE